MYPKVIVMIPTYNEAENINFLLDEILTVAPDVEVVVVDDNSPDGTWKIVQDRVDNRIHLLHRTEDRGRGRAGVAGFKYALGNGADYVIEMDGDFSHEPRFIPQLIEAARGADLVLGSRYVKGGRDCRRFIRRCISRLAGLYIRFILGISVKDPTSGFRCFKRKTLEDINLDTLRANDPFIVTEVLYRCYRENAWIKEMPIIFKDREKGSSKLGPGILFINLLKVLRLRLTG